MAPREGWAERAYRGLLRLLPRTFRCEAADAMLEVFRDGWARARSRGAVGRGVFWWRAVVDLLVVCAAERRAGHAARAGRAGGGRTPGLHRDVRFAARRLLRRPGPSWLSAGTLGLGVAASLVMLVLVRDILLRPLPFAEPDRLVRLLEETDQGRRFWPSYPNVRDWQEHAGVFEGVGAAGPPERRPVVLADRSVQAQVGQLSRDLLDVLGVRPAVGRGFVEREARPDGPAAALVSWAFWRGPLGGRPLEELSLTLERERVDVVGVLPPDFRFLAYGGSWGDADVWTSLDRAAEGSSRMSHGYHVVARLAPGITVATARRWMHDLAGRLRASYGSDTHAHAVPVLPLLDEVVGPVRRPLGTLLAAAVGVLLVACLNLGAALLGQGIGRARELSVRMALGASRAGVARQLVVEGLMLVVPALLAGLAAAWAALWALARLGGASLPRLEAVAMDGSDLLLGAALALGASLAASALPALAAGRRVEDLRERGSSAGRGQLRVWRAFVAGQLALTLVLVVGSGLLLRSFVAALQVDRGYRVEGVLTADVALPPSLYDEPERRLAFWEELLRRVRGLPGVEAAGLSTLAPHEQSALLTTVTSEDAPDDPAWAAFRLVDPGFFDALEIPLLRGTGLPARDGSDAVLIDRNLADALWPGRDPVGMRLSGGTMVVGVAGAVREWHQARGYGVLYVDYRTLPQRAASMTLAVAHAGRPDALAEAIRAAVAQIDPMVPVQVLSLDARLRGELGERQVLLLVATAFAAVTLLLASVGVYGVVSFIARRRVREAAIRLALGASPAQVSGHLVSHGLGPVALGIAVGLAGAFPAANALRSQVFGVGRFDPAVFVAAPLVLALAAALATWIPARRTAGVDPAVAFRQD